MKIIDQSYEILHITLDPLWQIEIAGRTCYKSEKKIGCTYLKDDQLELCKNIIWDVYGEFCTNIHCGSHSSHKFVKMLKDKGHDAMLEFGDITVRFITNRSVSHELVRHRLFSFAQESQRYVNYKEGIEFIRPVWCSNTVLGQHTIEWGNLVGIRKEGQLNPELPPAENVWFWNLATVERNYKWLLEKEWRTEQAKEILPNSTKTEIVVKGNFRQWMHCLKLRTSKKAFPQFRSLIQPLLKEFQNTIPIIFDNI